MQNKSEYEAHLSQASIRKQKFPLSVDIILYNVVKMLLFSTRSENIFWQASVIVCFNYAHLTQTSYFSAARIHKGNKRLEFQSRGPKESGCPCKSSTFLANLIIQGKGLIFLPLQISDDDSSHAEEPDFNRKQCERQDESALSPERASSSETTPSQDVLFETILYTFKFDPLPHDVNSTCISLSSSSFQDELNDIQDLESSFASFPIKPLQALKYFLFSKFILASIDTDFIQSNSRHWHTRCVFIQYSSLIIVLHKYPFCLVIHSYNVSKL